MLKESQRGVNEHYMRKMRASIKAGQHPPAFLEQLTQTHSPAVSPQYIFPFLFSAA